MSLRSRLLIGIAVLAVVQVLAAAAVILIATDQILDQVDERLDSAMDGVDLTTLDESDRISDQVYEGIVSPDGELRTLFPYLERGGTASPPQITLDDIIEAEGEPFTVDAERGQDEYRVLAVDAGDGSWFVVAGLLDGYEWTLNRLIRAIAIATAAVAIVLAAVAWWVLRLGVNPMKKMTAKAEAIAAGNFAERIEPAPPGTEVGQLGVALNTMMGTIESSFDEQARAEAQLRQFIADASHELRTPVATIRGYAELYRSGGLEDRAELDDAMRRTSEESERMSRLIADMLDLAKLDRGLAVDARPLDIDGLVRDAAADASVRHPNRAITVDTPEEATIVQGDEDLLRQAIVNLVSNAIVHTPDTACVNISTSADGKRVQVVVRDDGPGMSPEAAARATERFYRADPSRSRNRGGSGLGLAITAGVIEAHGGELAIDSELGQGTTVTITLPLAQPTLG